MIIISHRGNLNGPSDYENIPDNIDRAIDLGFFVEIDLRTDNNILYLGHDNLDTKINIDFLRERRNRLIIHAKDLKTANSLEGAVYNWFAHTNEPFVATSWGWLWLYPGYTSNNGIILDFGKPNGSLPKCRGICTDYPIEWSLI